jgi:hypothetical protein
LEKVPDSLEIQSQTIETEEIRTQHHGEHKYIYKELKCFINRNILLITEANQLNILGQVFRPIFCGKVIKVTKGTVTLFPVQVRMPQAPEFKFPTPLVFPLANLALFVPFDCDIRFPLT